MKSVIELEIDVPQARLATLFADPQQNTKWMDDVDSVETINSACPALNIGLCQRREKWSLSQRYLPGIFPANLI